VWYGSAAADPRAQFGDSGTVTAAGRASARRFQAVAPLPAFHAEADVAFDELPDHEFFARQQVGLAGQFLPDEGRSAAVVDNRGERLAEFAARWAMKPAEPGSSRS